MGHIIRKRKSANEKPSKSSKKMRNAYLPKLFTKIEISLHGILFNPFSAATSKLKMPSCTEQYQFLLIRKMCIHMYTYEAHNEILHSINHGIIYIIKYNNVTLLQRTYIESIRTAI